MVKSEFQKLTKQNYDNWFLIFLYYNDNNDTVSIKSSDFD